MSGASGRAIAHVGVLEVLRENNIPIDYITACSSATFIAAAFACGTMEDFKRWMLKLDKQGVLELLKFDRGGGGLFSLASAKTELDKFTLGKNFEEVKPNLNFVACDLNTGESVSLGLGDISSAALASCGVPGLFTPRKWGDKVIVDGGLLSLVPVEEAYKMGADAVIGVDIAATRHLFYKEYIYARRGYLFLRSSPPGKIVSWFLGLFSRLYENSVKIIFYSQSDFLAAREPENMPSLFSSLGKALDIANRTYDSVNPPRCEVMISPKVKKYGRMNFARQKKVYNEGRRAALAALPEIEKLLMRKKLRRRQNSALPGEAPNT